MSLHQPSRLLRLPRELRNEIYSYLIHAYTPPPTNPSFPGPRIWHDDIAHPKTYSSWRYPSLVWVNRQLRNEYFTLVEEYSSRRETKAVLDVMSKGYCFYPTWVFLPPDLLGEESYDLDVHLRIFSTEAYRSNDGWPRQPGSGFRCLLRLLNQLIHHGPSFGHHLELLRGRWLFAINTLTLHITFHDLYTPATWPETTHNIFRMLKALATHGVAGSVIRKIRVRCEYEHDGVKVLRDRTWDVESHCNPVRAAEWREFGFLAKDQRTLSDDYRSNADPDYV